jgi:hypothetical protein
MELEVKFCESVRQFSDYFMNISVMDTNSRAFGSRNNSVGIGTGRGSILDNGSLFTTTATRLSLGLIHRPIQSVMAALSAEVKLPGREASHSP